LLLDASVHGTWWGQQVFPEWEQYLQSQSQQVVPFPLEVLLLEMLEMLEVLEAYPLAQKVLEAYSQASPLAQEVLEAYPQVSPLAQGLLRQELAVELHEQLFEKHALLALEKPPGRLAHLLRCLGQHQLEYW
jgi:Lon protease-like protein